MLNIVRKVLKLAGPYKTKIKWSFVFSVLESLMANSPIFLVLYALMKLLDGSVTVADAWTVGIALVVSVVLRALMKYLVNVLESGTGYEIFSRERMALGNNLKKMNMGYFSEDNLGRISSVVTSDIMFIEEIGMETLAKVVSGYFGVIISCLIILIIDYRIGLILTAFALLAMIVLHLAQSKTKKVMQERQRTQEDLTSAVIEYVKGMPVTKAFNLSGKRSKATTSTFRDIRDVLIKAENMVIGSMIHIETYLAVGSGVIILACALLGLKSMMPVYIALMFIVFAFEVYMPIRLLSGVSPIIRIVEAGIDRYEKIRDEKVIDEDGKDIALNHFDIEFDNVSFAYEHDNVLSDVSFLAKENTMTALVGKSGCGKTTIANLVARFWDVQKGSVKVGGIDVREMTCDSLLKNISMVFQNVYLFNDTIINNIRFGKPEATLEEVIAVAKKARCHEFISKLEYCYDTMVGEGGCTLSGGEKQRISIARAMLKDAPIVLLDEATASVDPDNEAHIQEAIGELVKNKTLIVIAHKLSTIRCADQILVIDKGEIIESGTHETLISKSGRYSDFWQRRMNAKSWKIKESSN